MTLKTDIITTTDHVEQLVKAMGYNLEAFLETCGVKYGTFQSWKRMGTEPWKKMGAIPNYSALVLFNYVREFPDRYDAVRKVRVAVLEVCE